MSDNIPQSFKVEWLNTTLKFIKNDNQMIMEYPEMPTSHVEYLHNLMWQRKNDVGFGFKSLYAPLWEAMKIFSLKYRFKVSVTKSHDNTGQLLIEKIIKTTDQENKPINNNNDNSLTNKETVVQTKPNIKNKKKKQTKGEKYIEDKCKIIESISPTFLRPTLQRILEYLSDEKEASLIFTDLAPIEAKFLENFLGIYNRRHTFQKMLSPACNDILSEIRKWFIRFDQTMKLEIDASKNMKTAKREVTFLKIPRYVRPIMTRAMLKQKGEVTDSRTDNTKDVSPRYKFMKALSVNEKLSTLIKTPPAHVKVPSAVQTRYQNNTLEIKVQNDHFINNNSTGIDEASNTINYPVIDNNVNKPKLNVIVGNNEIYKESYTSPFRDNHRIAASSSTTDKTALKNEIGTDNEDKEIVKYYILHSEEIFNCDNNISNYKINTDNKEKNVIINNSAIDIKKAHSESKLKDNPEKSNPVNTTDRSSKTDEKYSHKISEATTRESNVGTDDKTKLINSNNVKHNNTTDTHNNCNIDKDVKNNKEVNSNVTSSQSSKDKTLLNSCKDITKENTATDVSKFLKDPNQTTISSSIKMSAFEKSTKPYSTSAAYGQEKLCQRKTKLIEAMSIPLESDKALRMMQRMGWQGGALGARGEGITEPIMPVLHLAPGAGLGHISEKSIKKQAENNFQIDILQTILDFLDKNKSERVVKYKNEISKKEKRFLKSALITFNKRTKVCLPSGTEYQLGEKIVNKMIIDCNLFIDITIKSNKKEIILKKIYTEDNIENKTKSIKKKTVDILPEHKPQSNNRSPTPDKDITNSNILKAPVKKFTFKRLIITKILAFMESENEFMKINFDSVLLPRYCQSIQKIVFNINKKQKFYNTCADNLPERVLENLGYISLKVEFSSNKMSVTIRQTLCENRINSATDTSSVTSLKHAITDVRDNASLSHNNNDNKTFRTNNESSNASDESDKHKHEVLKHESSKDIHENEFDTNNYYDELNQNNINIETGEGTHDNNQHIVSRGTSKNGISVWTNCDDDIKSTETLPPTNTILHKNIIKLNILKVPEKKHRFKLLIINKIIEFIDTDMKFIRIIFDSPPLPKYCKGVEKIVSNINNKQKFYNICAKDVPERVIENLGNFSLKVECGKHRMSFIIRKIFYENRCINSATNTTSETSQENLIDLKTGESTRDNNQQIESRGTSKYGMSVWTNCDDDINNKTENITRVKSNDPNNNRNESITETNLNNTKRAQTVLIIENLSNQSSTQSFKAIQNLIASKISENFIPHLKCHGVHNLGVIYSCYNKETYQWLKEVLSDYKITDYKNTTDKYTVQIKINTMLDVKKVFTLLEMCNVELCCDNWTVLEEKLGECSIFVVDIDDVSFNNVCDNNFKLSIGVDEAQFSLCCSL